MHLRFFPPGREENHDHRSLRAPNNWIEHVPRSRQTTPLGPGVMKRRFWTSSEFIPISVRSFSPPCEEGIRGGGPGGTMAWYAGPELLGLAELPAWPSMFVMPCPPPLTPPSQGG
jgi:hypothetical protein